MALGCLLSGALIGFTGGMLGIGGGLLAIPLLGLVLGMEQQMAQGTALIMVLPAVLLTVRKYHQRAKIDLRAAAAGAVSSIVFTWIGAQIALGLDSLLLRRVYAAFIFGIAIFYFYQGLRGRAPDKPVMPRRDASEFHNGWFVLIGVMAGMASGIFGVGGVVLAVPIMTTFLNLSQIGAQALALMMVIPGLFVGLFAYTSHGQVDWLVGVPLALGSIAFVPYGVKFAYGLPEPRLKTFFACMLLVIIYLLLIKA